MSFAATSAAMNHPEIKHHGVGPVVDLAVDSACILGEGVLRCEREQILLWTDIQSSRLWRYHLRGEETQVCGLLDSLSAGHHLACLAGTHSKHVEIQDGCIERFTTSMTGEMFNVLCQHSILGRLMQPGEHQPAAFAQGVARAAEPGGLLSHLFAVRTQGLFGALQSNELQSYLSGLLIGHELNDIPGATGPMHLVAAPSLLEPYEAAFAQRGRRVQSHSELTSAQGLYAVAAKRGLLEQDK